MLIMREKFREKLAEIRKNDKNNINPNVLKKSADKIFIMLFVISLILLGITNYSSEFGIFYTTFSRIVSIVDGFKYFFIPSLILAGLSVILDKNFKEKKLIPRVIISILIIVGGSILLPLFIGLGTIPTINYIKKEIVNKDLTLELIKKEVTGSNKKSFDLTFKDKNKELIYLEVNRNFYYNIKIGEKIIVDKYRGVFKIEFYKYLRKIN